MYHDRKVCLFPKQGLPILRRSTIQLLLILLIASSGFIASTIFFQRKLFGYDVHTDYDLDALLNRPQELEKPPTVEECLALNSEGWVKGPRVGNTRTGEITSPVANQMILTVPGLFSPVGSGSAHSLLRQTICHNQSQFLNFAYAGSEGQKSVEFWALRLVYLSIYVHQHKGAVREARLRQTLLCDQVMDQYSIGTFDFECPDSKFLVVPLRGKGLGAVIRLGVVNALFAGIATNRTVLFVNNVTFGDGSLRKPWAHATCDRGDFQCFFMPPSPCTLTNSEITSAYSLNSGESRRMFKFGQIPNGHNDDRVIVSNFALRPKHTPPGFLEAIMRYTDTFIEDAAREATSPDDPRIEILKKSKAMISSNHSFDQQRIYHYFGVASRTHHAAVFYAMRPNPFYAKRLDEIHNLIVPENFNPEISFGLPIRASDKCLAESECLTFPQHMKVMGQIWHAHQQSIRQSAKEHGIVNLTVPIILTSESQGILRDKDIFEKDEAGRQSVPFSFQFVMNDQDVMQGTGSVEDYLKNSSRLSTQEDVMLSMISSLRLQLLARHTIGNCCSNFHLLLFDFLQDGCGAAQDSNPQCLQENEDPEFRICCGWSKSDECTRKSKAQGTTQE